uniref:Uncharacterized protein n=1 Tax=Rhizophora mucronata TaxID=61149 RepID=A0A2P2N2G5_RHIMU
MSSLQSSYQIFRHITHQLLNNKIISNKQQLRGHLLRF